MASGLAGRLMLTSSSSGAAPCAQHYWQAGRMSGSGRWEFWIDRGGTFTDIVARRPDGGLTVRKLLSENPGRYADPAVEGIRRLLQVPDKEPIPAERIAAVRLGTRSEEHT